MSIPKHFNIFYSWQSDVDKNANNYFIKNCIEKAIKEIKRDESYTIIPRIDKDTKGMTGSPKITDTILSKIDSCNIFIADLTLINFNWFNRMCKRRFTPNPNVLFELGYALYRLGWERMICLNNKAFSDIKHMPFDLQQNRISQYYFNGKNDKKESKDKLTALLKTAIIEIASNFNTLESKNSQVSISTHDVNIFKNLDNILNDTSFIDLINHIGDNYIVSSDEYKIIDEFCDYLKAERNQFLIEELKSNSKLLYDSLDKARGILAKNLESYTMPRNYNEQGEKIMGTIYKLPDFMDYCGNLNEYSKKQRSMIEEIIAAIDNVISNYKDFRAAIKKKLFI